MIMQHCSVVSLAKQILPNMSYVDTGDATSVKLPPRPIPFHYSDQVQRQLKNMAEEGIIRHSNSPLTCSNCPCPKE